MELRHSNWAILNDKLICVTKREVSMQRGEIMWKGIGNMKMVRGRKFGVWQPWKVERKYCGIGIGKMKMARGRKFGVCVSMAALEGGGGGGEEKKGGRGEARMGPGKPWIGGGENESTLAVLTLFE
jgi:hypothetical protein